MNKYTLHHPQFTRTVKPKPGEKTSEKKLIQGIKTPCSCDIFPHFKNVQQQLQSLQPRRYPRGLHV